MIVEILPVLKDNFCYLLHFGSATTVIDPGEARPVLEHLNSQNRRLELILCTHLHHDHIDGALPLSQHYGCPIWAAKLEMTKIPGCGRGLQDGETVQVAGEEMQAIHVPGHTAGQLSYYFPKSQNVFTGDTLFSLGCGRLFEGTPKEMFASLKKLASLPDSTQIYFGHEYTLRNGDFTKGLDPDDPALNDYLKGVEKNLEAGGHSSPTTMELEKRLNPFLNTDSLEEWTRRRNLRNLF